MFTIFGAGSYSGLLLLYYLRFHTLDPLVNGRLDTADLVVVQRLELLLGVAHPLLGAEEAEGLVVGGGAGGAQGHQGLRAGPDVEPWHQDEESEYQDRGATLQELCSYHLAAPSASPRCWTEPG